MATITNTNTSGTIESDKDINNYGMITNHNIITLNSNSLFLNYDSITNYNTITMLIKNEEVGRIYFEIIIPNINLHIIICS